MKGSTAMMVGLAVAMTGSGCLEQNSGELLIPALDPADCAAFCADTMRVAIWNEGGAMLVEREVACGTPVSLSTIPHDETLRVRVEVAGAGPTLSAEQEVTVEPDVVGTPLDLQLLVDPASRPQLMAAETASLTPRIFPLGTSIRLIAEPGVTLLEDGAPIDAARLNRADDGSVEVQAPYGWDGGTFEAVRCGSVSEPVVVVAHNVRVESSPGVLPTPRHDLIYSNSGEVNACTVFNPPAPIGMRPLAQQTQNDKDQVTLLYSCITGMKDTPVVPRLLCGAIASVAYLDASTCQVLMSHPAGQCPHAMAFSSDQSLLGQTLLRDSFTRLRVRDVQRNTQGTANKSDGVWRGVAGVHGGIVSVADNDDGSETLNVLNDERDVVASVALASGATLEVLRDDVALVAQDDAPSLVGYSYDGAATLSLTPTAGPCPLDCPTRVSMATERQWSDAGQQWNTTRVAIHCRDASGQNTVAVHEVGPDGPNCTPSSRFGITPLNPYTKLQFDPSGQELWTLSFNRMDAYRVSDGAALGTFTPANIGIIPSTDRLLSAEAPGTGSFLVTRSTDQVFTRVVGSPGAVACEQHPTAVWAPWTPTAP